MIDLHSHILPGVDDGVETIEEARELRACCRRRRCHDNRGDPACPRGLSDDARADGGQRCRSSRGLRQTRDRCEVLHGGEVDLEVLPSLSDDAIRRFTLGQTGRYLLVEFPYHGWPLSLTATVFRLELNGITPVLAHPERNLEVQSAPELLRPLVDAGALVQVTAAALNGRLGHGAHRAAEKLVRLGLTHLNCKRCPWCNRSKFLGSPGLADSLGDDALWCYLTESAPAAIVAGESLPPRPVSARKLRRPFGRGP